MRADLLALPSDWSLCRVGRDKAPIGGRGWYDNDRHSPDQAASLNGSGPPAWGLLCGEASGALVLDLDADGWGESFQQVTGHPITDLPRTIAWSSGKDGRSGRAFSVPIEWWPSLRNRAFWDRPWRDGERPADAKADGTTMWELRWTGHQSVIIGAHPETGRYRWREGCSPHDIPDPAEAPDWLLQLLLIQEHPQATPVEPTAEDAARAAAMLQCIPAADHSSYSEWLTVGMALHHTDPGLLADWVEWSRQMATFDEAECQAKWESFGKGHKGRPATIATLHYLAKQHGYEEPKRKRQAPKHRDVNRPQLEVLEGGGAPGTGLKGLLGIIPSGWWRTKDGQPRKTSADAGDLAQIVRKAAPGLARFNDLTRRIEFAGEAIEEDRAAVFYAKLQAHGYKISSQHTTDAVLDVAYDGRYHPVRQYLDAVAGASEVAPADLATIASTYLGTSDPLANSMLRKALIGAVARVYDPGCQFDSVCVFRGKQGIRKSTFWKVLASPGWFNCTAPDNDKDLILNIHSCWIFELAELENITGKREVGQLRNLITTSTDHIRVPYGKTTADYPRRSIFVGSVNGDAFLRDEEGSRRFWVIECPQDFDRGELIDVDRVRRDRDAIWKAAVLAYRAGEEPCLSHAEQVASNRQNDRYEREHEWAAQLDAWVRRRGAEPFTTAEALIGAKCCMEGHVTTKAAMDAAAVMKKLGLQKEANPSRTGTGGRSRRWHNLAQPGTTSPPEVVPGQTPVAPVALSTPAQPAQPISRKVGGVEEERQAESAAGDFSELLRLEVVPPPQGRPDPLHPNGSTPAQPQTPEVVPEVVPGQLSVSPRTIPATEPPWHAIARQLQAEHPEWSPSTVALGLGAEFRHVTGRAVMAFLAGDAEA